MKLNKKQMLLISFMLFSLFFGAGNLIFPPFLGQNAGSNTISAMIGFLITAVILPILGVIVVAQFEGLEKLGKNVGVKFSIIFTLLIYLSIGPGLGIPRAASVPFEMAVAPYLPEGSNLTLWMIIYSLVFFVIAFEAITKTCPVYPCFINKLYIDAKYLFWNALSRVERSITPALVIRILFIFLVSSAVLAK